MQSGAEKPIHGQRVKKREIFHYKVATGLSCGEILNEWSK